MTLANYKGFKKRQVDVEDDVQPTKPTAVKHDHPSALKYVQIGIVLAIVTAIEVAFFYIELETNLLVTLLFLLSGLKFLFVVMWFMHLKFDHPILSQSFVAGMALAFAVFMVMIATLGGGLL